MNQRPTIREQMDACRPDSDDLFLPEHAVDLVALQAGLCESEKVRGEWERSQQDGRIIRGAMHDVALPAGLEARLLAAVQGAQAAALPGLDQAVREEAPAKDIQATPARVNRRWFMTAVASLMGTAALVLVGFWVIQSLTQTEQSITKDQLASQVEGWLLAVDIRTMNKPAKPNFPPPGKFVLGTIAGSRSISTGQGTITAYSVKLGGSHAVLLEIPTARQYPVGALPYSTVPGISGGWNVGAWQQDRILYIIAVPANSGTRLDQFVPRQPIG